MREATAAGMLLSVLVEDAQWETGRRWADVDDVLANTLGAFLGAVAAVAVLELLRRRVTQSR